MSGPWDFLTTGRTRTFGKTECEIRLSIAKTLMEPRLLFLILLGLIIGLCYIIRFWRRKAGESAYIAAQNASREDERDRYCRLAVMAGHRDACRMFCCIYSERFDDRRPLKPFRFHGIRIAFYGYYYPSRYNDFLNEAQRTFCRSIYQFKQGEIHGGKAMRL